MTVLLLAHQKGGVGKSTIAFNLAVMRSRRKSVLVIDADPQQSLVNLLNIRKNKPMPAEFFHVAGDAIHKGVTNVIDDFDDIIIDSAGRDSESLKSSFFAADKVLIPFKPSRLDILKLQAMDELADVAVEFNPDRKVFAVISMASTHAQEKETKMAKFEFKKFKHITLLDVIIRDRLIYRQSLNEGQAIFETSNKKAINEINTLYKKVF